MVPDALTLCPSLDGTHSLPIFRHNTWSYSLRQAVHLTRRVPRKLFDKSLRLTMGPPDLSKVARNIQCSPSLSSPNGPCGASRGRVMVCTGDCCRKRITLPLHPRPAHCDLPSPPSPPCFTLASAPGSSWFRVLDILTTSRPHLKSDRSGNISATPTPPQSNTFK